MEIFSGIANDAKTNFPEIPFLKSETTVGTLNFGTAIYQGDIKKEKHMVTECLNFLMEHNIKDI